MAFTTANLYLACESKFCGAFCEFVLYYTIAVAVLYTIFCYIESVNHSSAETIIFQQELVNIIAADVLTT